MGVVQPADPLEILLFSWDGGGNVPPFLALGRHLLARGHRVRMVGHDSIAARAGAAGVDFAAFGGVPSWSPRPGRALEDEMEALAAHLLGPEFGDELLAATNRSRPHALVVDCMAGGSLSVAEHLGLPAAVLVHLRARFHFDAGGGSSLATRAPRESLNRQRVRLGLDPLPVEQSWWGALWRRAGQVFIASLPELEGAGEPLPEDFTYVGGVFDPEPADLPGDVVELIARAGGPLVVVSLSTTYMHQEPQIAAALGALDGLRGVLSIGDGLELKDPESRYVVVARWVPHQSLLPHADLVVTHAGHGTVMAALAAGVPLVCLPMGRDQHGTAEQVAAVGAGVSLDSSSDATHLRSAIDRVLTERSFRRCAENLAASMRRLGGAYRLAAEVEALARPEPLVRAHQTAARKRF